MQLGGWPHERWATGAQANAALNTYLFFSTACCRYAAELGIQPPTVICSVMIYSSNCSRELPQRADPKTSTLNPKPETRSTQAEAGMGGRSKPCWGRTSSFCAAQSMGTRARGDPCP